MGKLAHEFKLDGVDLRLLHALQEEPRAAWSAIAPIVRVDASGLSRRWQKMKESGIAWVTGLAETTVPGSVALVDIDCEAGAMEEVARSLERDSEIVTLDCTTGSRDLLATVFATSEGEMSRYLLHRFNGLMGIRATRTYLVTGIIADARRWRLQELSETEVPSIPRPHAPRARASHHVPKELMRAVFAELGADGRTPASVIAQRYGFTAQRVADAISEMRTSGMLYFRTDLARLWSPWPVYTWYFLQIRADQIQHAKDELQAMVEIRLAVLSASRFNLILAVWLPRIEDVHAFEEMLAKRLPGSLVVDRSVVLLTRKHLGHLLNEEGRATGEIVTMPILSGQA
ncbi:MAG: Lrp/AsnC family transcriptional regulator [Ancrocorticia sp.]|jgi:DNA-binding Lrp family transcriptional regulator|nr:Lrp/AsnC family transcriptional regulator [Ancrocorticia sp.]MCI1964158.1 Lrp/AsnC family transcriptional regulator [Ancrocorticia sp.]MCI2002595.1 Lrp/AsnC family transcriptional regulator [Ancrocorticia sp.]MCI2012576.1 Lrp/AsnC family transcriptional regulator [Ancrocorticia sp.]MCI2177893.1 Lrp/AsnC family transcriptional regulator [Ancrocorticia sp.]